MTQNCSDKQIIEALANLLDTLLDRAKIGTGAAGIVDAQALQGRLLQIQNTFPERYRKEANAIIKAKTDVIIATAVLAVVTAEVLDGADANGVVDKLQHSLKISGQGKSHIEEWLRQKALGQVEKNYRVYTTSTGATRAITANEMAQQAMQDYQNAWNPPK